MKQKLVLIFLILNLTACQSHAYKILYKKHPAFYSYIIGDINNIHQEYISDVFITPASCQKIITALIAIKELGPEYKYRTKLYTRKNNNKIENAVIAFSGDFTLSSENLITLLKPLENIFIKDNLILDASAFTVNPHSENIIIGDIGTSYAQPASAIIIDENLINLTILPDNINYLTNISIDVPIYNINSKAITNNKINEISRTWNKDNIEITGNINFNSKPQFFKLSPLNANEYFKFKMEAILKKLNIKTKLKIIYDKKDIPTGLTLINKIDSKPLKEILQPALKQSNNLAFDSLYLTLLHRNILEGVSYWHDGDAVIKSLLKKHFNLDFNYGAFYDGSGLSRYNKIQPKQLFLLLQKGLNVKEFVESLPYPSEDNTTLKNYEYLSSNIKAKTGTMSGIRVLSGYYISSKTTKVFVFFVSGFKSPYGNLPVNLNKFIQKELDK
jgi:D-alanyl-D-alanine carboxypeptidase/D-alanyl-D-alanine-endopeptidase (penicillin-binding protein 4)